MLYSIYDVDRDIAGKWVDFNVKEEFDSLKNVSFPNGFDNIRSGKIENVVDNNVEVSYSLIAFTSNDNPYVQIDITKDNYMPNCYWNYNDFKDDLSSYINDVEVKLFMRDNVEDKSKISGVCFFEYDNFKYRIEVYKIIKDEFIDIIKDIVYSKE